MIPKTCRPFIAVCAWAAVTLAQAQSGFSIATVDSPGDIGLSRPPSESTDSLIAYVDSSHGVAPGDVVR